MTAESYEQREATMLHKQIADLSNAPLADRKSAAVDWAFALAECAAHPNDCTLTERAGWLFNGDYGKGAYDRAHAIANQKRGNKTAALGQLLAAVEWQCPNTEARWGWNQLTYEAQDIVTAALERIIEAHR